MKNFVLFLTYTRIVCAPIIFILIIFFQEFVFSLFLFILAAISDYFDGVLARRYEVSSDLGAILDPIADKVLLLFLLFAISISTQNDYIGLFAAIILAREFWVSALREYNSRNQNSAKTDVTFLAKAKTTFQFLAISLYLFGMAYNMQLVIFLGSFVFFFALLLSLKTGLNYTKATFIDEIN
jgi:CDP-diacylglycerol--glycerol-3-phosphate 3-phosphatidyltransferase